MVFFQISALHSQVYLLKNLEPFFSILVGKCLNVPSWTLKSRTLNLSLRTLNLLLLSVEVKLLTSKKKNHNKQWNVFCSCTHSGGGNGFFRGSLFVKSLRVSWLQKYISLQSSDTVSRTFKGSPTGTVQILVKFHILEPEILLKNPLFSRSWSCYHGSSCNLSLIWTDVLQTAKRALKDFCKFSLLLRPQSLKKH